MPFLPLPKAKAKLLRKLEQRKYRQEEQLFVAEGYRSIHQIVESSPEAIQFLVCSESYSQPEFSKPIPTYLLGDKEFAGFSNTEHSQGILAVVSMPKEQSPTEILTKASLILALDAIQDPGNLGTMIRNAQWFGADALVLGNGTVDLFNPKVIRSCKSNLHECSFFHADLSSFFKDAEAQGWQLFLLRLDDAATQLHECIFTAKAIIVIGNEGNGIQPSLIKPNRTSVFIPGFSPNEVESLNAATASALALYEYRRKTKSQ